MSGSQRDQRVDRVGTRAILLGQRGQQGVELLQLGRVRTAGPAVVRRGQPLAP
ncbi:hypothetical protein [Nonomuraea recticatena]|uniref:hypothetical protein n=1 Tax=Nonomuraea recticatena TaxID=46178 RepID=UPI0031F84F4F